MDRERRYHEKVQIELKGRAEADGITLAYELDKKKQSQRRKLKKRLQNRKADEDSPVPVAILDDMAAEPKSDQVSQGMVTKEIAMQRVGGNDNDEDQEYYDALADLQRMARYRDDQGKVIKETSERANRAKNKLRIDAKKRHHKVVRKYHEVADRIKFLKGLGELNNKLRGDGDEDGHGHGDRDGVSS